MKRRYLGFSLIELLVVIAVLMSLAAISVFALTGARTGARDARRKSDLETLRSALELYKADCNTYPATNRVVAGSSLTGTSASAGARCSTSNVYIASVPDDPTAGYDYEYVQTSAGASYELCSTLEKQGTAVAVSCGGATNVCGTTCYYKVTSP